MTTNIDLSHLTNEQIASLLCSSKRLHAEGLLSMSPALPATERLMGIASGKEMETPSEFRRRLLINSGGDLRPLDDCLDPWQREDYETADRGWMRMVEGRGDAKLNYYFERPKGHDKTTGLATMSLWALYASPRQITGVAGAGKLEQAAFLRDAAGAMVSQNPWLRDRVKVHNYEVVNQATGSRLHILTRASDTNQGWNPDFIICDEISVWADRGLWDALFSASAKKANCLVCIIANAGRGKGASWQWILREKCRTSAETWHFRSLQGVQASWLTEEKLREQTVGLHPLEYQRLWLNQWTLETGDALEASDVEAACVLPCMPRERDGNFDFYVAGLDLSLTRHHSAFCVVATNPARDKIRLMHLRNWNPADYDGRLSLSEIEDYVFEVCRFFRVESLHADSAFSEQMMQNLSRRGIPKTINWRAGPSLQKRQAQAIVNTFKQRRFEMWRDEGLFNDLLRLNIRDMGEYVKLEAPEDEMGHCDRAMALSHCLHVAADVLDSTRGDYQQPQTSAATVPAWSSNMKAPT